MRKITKISEKLRKETENKLAIFALLDYQFEDSKTAYVFADGHLAEIIFE